MSGNTLHKEIAAVEGKNQSKQSKKAAKNSSVSANDFNEIEDVLGYKDPST